MKRKKKDAEDMAKKQAEIDERKKKIDKKKKEKKEKDKKDKEAREAQQAAAAKSGPDDANLRNLKGKAVQDIRNCMLADDIKKIRTTISEAKQLGVMDMPIAARAAQLLAKLEVVDTHMNSGDAVKLKADIEDAKTLGIDSPILAKARVK